MDQLNTYRFYELGSKLHGLFCASTHNRVSDLFVPLTETQSLLDSFIKGDVFALDTSKADATRLLNRLGALFNRYFIDPATKQLKDVTGEDRVDAHEISLINTLIEKFEHALAAELSRLPAYVAGKRGIYSTYDLAEQADRIFSDAQRKVIPAHAQNEFAAAGRTLAFGFGTASVVHMLRATEITLRAYYESFSAASLAKNERTYSIYLKKLLTLVEEDDKGHVPDKRILQMLTQIKDHHRNPLMMPETTVTVDEATQLFGMVSAVIALMADALPKATSKNDSNKAEKKVSEETAAKTAAALAPTLEQLGEETEVYDYPLSQVG